MGFLKFLQTAYRKSCETLKIRLKYFLENSTIGGIRFLSDKTGVLGKIFWSIVLVTSFVGMLKIFVLTADRFTNEDISIAFDTAYLFWNSTFPAVSVCLKKGTKSTLIKDYLTENNVEYSGNAIRLSKTIHSYLFTSPDMLLPVKDECKQLNQTCGVDFEVLREKFVPKSCKDVMENVKFARKSYENCEDIFKFHQTEVGNCFIANSIADYNYNYENLPLKFNPQTLERTLEFQQKPADFWQNMIFVHSPEDMPYFISTALILKTEPTIYYIGMQEILNWKGVEDSRIENRIDLRVGTIVAIFQFKLNNNHNSFSTCINDLTVKVSLETCNCTLFTSHNIYKKLYCDMYGIECILSDKIYNKVKELHFTKNSTCLPSCLEQRIYKVGDMKHVKNISGLVAVNIINLPTLRYIRHVAKTKLDLVVAIGGVAGLFFGASLLSIVEIIYIWCIRKP